MRNTILATLVLFLLAMVAMAADFDSYVYWVPSGTKKTVAWTAPEGGADGYEIYVWQLENSQRFLSGRVVFQNSIEITWKTPGHYIVYCRAFKDVGGVRQWSEWVNTLDPTVGLVNEHPRAWVLYVAPR